MSIEYHTKQKANTHEKDGSISFAPTAIEADQIQINLIWATIYLEDILTAGVVGGTI